MRWLTIPFGDCDAENIAPFGIPANFEHDRFLQFWGFPSCLSYTPAPSESRQQGPAEHDSPRQGIAGARS